MNYMLLIYQNEETPNATKIPDDGGRPCEGLVERLEASGQYVAAGILQPTTCATSVRVRDGRRILTDGPFAETREQLAGYLLIDAANLDEALAIAAQHPVARTGTVEIRPVKEIPFLTRVKPAETA
ncbi:MAG: YciI family protein [Armatimonadota bacterium]